jgi:hypothetical protein
VLAGAPAPRQRPAAQQRQALADASRLSSFACPDGKTAMSPAGARATFVAVATGA